jgi:hypothetical protein
MCSHLFHFLVPSVLYSKCVVLALLVEENYPNSSIDDSSVLTVPKACNQAFLISDKCSKELFGLVISCGHNLYVLVTYSYTPSCCRMWAY